MRWTSSVIFLLAASIAGCSSQGQSRRDSIGTTATTGDSGRGVAATPVVSATTGTTSGATTAAATVDSGKGTPVSLGAPSGNFVAGAHLKDAPATVRALYVNRWAAQSREKMRKLISIADETEINGLVLDLKDEFGLNFASKDTAVARNAGRSGTIPHLKELIDTLHAHGLVVVARQVTFKDSVAARVNPQHTIRKPDGSPWRDKQGLTWVDPYDPMIREYNIRVAEELARMGFDEIQFDYVRFPDAQGLAFAQPTTRCRASKRSPASCARRGGGSRPTMSSSRSTSSAMCAGIATTPASASASKTWRR